MKKKLYSHLRLHPSGVSASNVVRDVLRLEGASESVADRLLDSLLRDDSRFQKNADGLWTLSPEAVAHLGLLDLPYLIAVSDAPGGGRTTEDRFIFSLSERARPSGFGELRRSWSSSGATFELRLPGAVGDAVRTSREHHALLSALDRAFVVEFSGEFFFRAINEYSVQLRGEPTECEPMSVSALSRVIMKKKYASPFELANALGATAADTGSAEDRLSALEDSFFTLLETCRQRNLNSMDELLEELERKKTPPDYKRYKFDRQLLESLPESPGVYLMKTSIGELLYVGKAKNLKRRVRSYFRSGEVTDKKLSLLRTHLYDLEVRPTGSELEALLAEHSLISRHSPPLNTQEKVHARTVGSKIRINCVLLLPSVHPGSVELFLLTKNGHLAQRRCPQRKTPTDEVKEVLERLYFSESRAEPETERREKSEIAFSWLAQHRDRVTMVDVDAAADAQDCIRLIEAHLKEFNPAAKHIIR